MIPVRPVWVNKVICRYIDCTLILTKGQTNIRRDVTQKVSKGGDGAESGES